MKYKWMNYIVALIAIIVGAIYCIYLQNYNIDFFKDIYKRMLNLYEQQMSGKVIFELIFDYVKKMCILFTMGSFGSLMPLGIIVICIIIFSYSFSISCFIALYGIKGAVVSFLLYGVQSIVIIVCGFYVLNYKKRIIEGKNNIISTLGIVILGLGIVVSLDLIGILNFNVIRQILI